MKKSSQVLGIAAIALAVAAGAAVAQGPPPAGGGLHGMHHRMAMVSADEHLDHLAVALRLSDEQKASLQSLHTELMNSVEPLMEQARAAGQQLHDAVAAGSTDACALGQLVLQAHGNDAALSAAHEQFDAAFTALLTPEQKSEYDAIKAMHPAFRHGAPIAAPGVEK
jgi:Spy/CpxP family protein refolding chaperone